MFYTYIIQSINTPSKRYIGHTSDLKQRLSYHNSGKNKSTANQKPWKIVVYLAFETLEQAQHMERYLKSGSGKSFAKRHFFLPKAALKEICRLSRRSR